MAANLTMDNGSTTVEVDKSSRAIMNTSNFRILEDLPGIAGTEKIKTALNSVNQKELNVVVAGEFNSGKSMLINSLMGRSLLTSSAVPTTGQITLLRFGHQESVHVRLQDGSEKVNGMDFLDRVTTLDQNGTAVANVDQVTVYVKNEFLNPNMVLVDTPGTNDDIAQTRRALGALETADAILWVLRANDPLKQQERVLAGKWLTKNPGAILCPIVNFMNMVSPGEQDAVRLRLTGLLERLHGSRVGWMKELAGRPFFEIDVQRTLDWVGSGEGEADRDFLSLATWLQQINRVRADQVKARSRAGRLIHTIKELRTENDEQLTKLRERVNELRSDRENLRREHESVLRRFQSRADTYLAILERETLESLSETGDYLISYWLKGESSSSLREKTNNWGNVQLQKSVNLAVASINTSYAALMNEYSLVPNDLWGRQHTLKIIFKVTLPGGDFWSEARDMVGASATSGYMSTVTSLVRSEWRIRAAEVMSELKRVWGAMAEELRDGLRRRHAAQELKAPQGWTWIVSNDLVAIKSREIWVRRGAPDPPPTPVSKFVSGFKKLLGRDHVPVPGPDRQDRGEAKRLMEQLASKGTPLCEEICLREMSEATLEFLQVQTENELSAIRA